MYVLLFDIDGTLINSRGAGRAALDAALESVFGVTTPHEVQVTGRTDRGIARDLFRLHRLDNSKRNWERFRAAYLEQLEKHLPLRAGSVLPGVAQLLQRLARRSDVALGLLTGNMQAGARIKLEHFELFEYFAFGGFGDDHPERDDVARQALNAAQRHVNRRLSMDRVWVIGDTPLDIQCARAIDARVAAVATGWHSREELQADQPDLLLDDLAAADQWLRLMPEAA